MWAERTYNFIAVIIGLTVIINTANIIFTYRENLFNVKFDEANSNSLPSN